jgi:hypothetical protein
MTRSVDLGAPSLTGKDANDLVAKVFADAAYPLKVVVQNHMPRNVVFPEVDGLFLFHVANREESRKEVVIASHDLFQRLASSIEQIAELNHYPLALTITEVSAAGKPPKAKPSDGLTYEQIKDALEAKGIDFPSNAKKSVLSALLDDADLTEDAGEAVTA